MSEDAGKGEDTRPRRPRRSAKTLRGNQRTPAPGKRFPSEICGDNVRLLRQMRRLRQQDLAEWMNDVGFPGWSYVTVSDIERGIRSTSIDELFALAFALRASVVKLLDPSFSGDQGPDIDLGFELFKEWQPKHARLFVVPDGDPWGLDQDGVPYATYRKAFEQRVRDIEEGDFDFETGKPYEVDHPQEELDEP